MGNIQRKFYLGKSKNSLKLDFFTPLSHPKKIRTQFKQSFTFRTFITLISFGKVSGSQVQKKILFPNSRYPSKVKLQRSDEKGSNNFLVNGEHFSTCLFTPQENVLFFEDVFYLVSSSLKKKSYILFTLRFFFHPQSMSSAGIRLLLKLGLRAKSSFFRHLITTSTFTLASLKWRQKRPKNQYALEKPS